MSTFDYDPNEVIDALGGTNAVARMCQIKPGSVSDWRKTGIPNARLMYLKLAAPAVFRSLKTASKKSPKKAA